MRVAVLGSFHTVPGSVRLGVIHSSMKGRDVNGSCAGDVYVCQEKEAVRDFCKERGCAEFQPRGEDRVRGKDVIDGGGASAVPARNSGGPHAGLEVAPEPHGVRGRKAVEVSGQNSVAKLAQYC